MLFIHWKLEYSPDFSIVRTEVLLEFLTLPSSIRDLMWHLLHVIDLWPTMICWTNKLGDIDIDRWKILTSILQSLFLQHCWVWHHTETKGQGQDRKFSRPHGSSLAQGAVPTHFKDHVIENIEEENGSRTNIYFWNLGETKEQCTILSLLVQSNCASSPTLPLHFSSSFVTKILLSHKFGHISKLFSPDAHENNLSLQFGSNENYFHLLRLPLSHQLLPFRLLYESPLWWLWCCTF